MTNHSIVVSLCRKLLETKHPLAFGKRGKLFETNHTLEAIPLYLVYVGNCWKLIIRWKLFVTNNHV